MEFKQPNKICPKCKCIIPTNGYEKDKHGHDLLDSSLRPIYHKTALLVCEYCALAACPPPPAKPRRKRGEQIEGQAVIEAPMIFIS